MRFTVFFDQDGNFVKAIVHLNTRDDQRERHYAR